MTKKDEDRQQLKDELKKEVKEEMKEELLAEVEKKYILGNINEDKKKIFDDFLSRNYFAMSKLRKIKAVDAGPYREKIKKICELSGWIQIKSIGGQKVKAYFINSKKYDPLPMKEAVEIFNKLETASRLKNKVTTRELKERSNFISAMVLHGISSEHASKIARIIKKIFDDNGERQRMNDRFFKMRGGDSEDEHH
jgi:hypothetical protein